MNGKRKEHKHGILRKWGGTKWNLLGSKIGTAALNLPTNFNELLIIVTISGTTVEIPIVIPKNTLTNSTKSFRGGYYGGTNTYVGVAAYVSLTTATLQMAVNTGNDVTSTSTTTVYYR